MRVVRYQFENLLKDHVSAGVDPAPEKPVVITVAENDNKGEVVPEVPLITEADVKAREDAAYQRGAAEVKAAWDAHKQKEETAHKQALEKSLEALKIGLASLQENQIKQQQEVAHHATELALQVAKKVAGDAIKQAPKDRVMSIIQQTLPLLMPKSGIAITVHPSLQELVQKETASLLAQSGFQGQMKVEASEDILPGDAQLAWSDGGVRASADELWQNIKAHIEQYTDA